MKGAMKSIVFFIFLSSQLFAQTLTTINLPSPIKGSLSLSDLAASMEYIKLEQTTQCIIGRVGRYYDISDNYILCSCQITGNVFLFTRQGKFVCQISRKGNGPAEYIYLTGVAIDEANKRIILCSQEPNKCMYFDLKGKYLKKANTNEAICGLKLVDQGKLLSMKENSSGDIAYTYQLFDNNFKLLCSMVRPVQFQMKERGAVFVPQAFSYYEYDKKFHVKDNILNDTLYSLEKNCIMRPKYIFNSGRYAFNLAVRTDVKLFLKEVGNQLMISNVFETSEELLVNYELHNEHLYCYYNKKNGKLYQFDSKSGIPNDYDGGPNFWPELQKNGTLISFIDAYTLSNELKDNKKQITVKGRPEVLARWTTLYKQLDTEDNPVVIFVKLKH